MPSHDDVMRTIIEIPDEQIRALDAWRRTRGLTRAEAVRRAVSGLLHDEAEVRSSVAAAFGLWRGRALDGMAEQERLRAEWDDR
jgi:metal-responsive CopG/Arc/MetJ family transcriptional regulator